MSDINIGQITEALNNKVDLQAPWGFPKKQYDNLTITASDQEFTAPANGYFCISARASGAGSWFFMTINNTGLCCTSHVEQSGSNHEFFIPVGKNQVCHVAYGGIQSINYFHFVYAQTTN